MRLRAGIYYIHVHIYSPQWCRYYIPWYSHCSHCICTCILGMSLWGDLCNREPPPGDYTWSIDHLLLTCKGCEDACRATWPGQAYFFTLAWGCICVCVCIYIRYTLQRAEYTYKPGTHSECSQGNTTHSKARIHLLQCQIWGVVAGVPVNTTTEGIDKGV